MYRNPHNRRVVITGIGVIAANGCTLPTFWESLVKGVSGAGLVTRFKADDVPNRVAAEVKNFEPLKYLSPRQARRFELSIQFGIAAAKLAVEDSGVVMGKIDPDRLGIVEATSVGGMESTLKAHKTFLEKGYKAMSPFTFINAYCGGGSGEIALELKIKGHAITYCSGSCSGNDAIGYALRMVQSDEADLMVAGGAEAPLLEGFWHGFCVTKVMTRRNDKPASAMRPFDKTRDGFVLGEGAAYLVLEELSHALDRGSQIYAEVIGHGRSCEAYDSVAPHPEGTGLSRALEKGLRDARLTPGEIDYINAHGTATHNDIAETRGIKNLLKKHAKKVAISSTKPVTGHLMGAAGALETAICALAVRNQIIPPTINLESPDEECDLDYVPKQARPYPINVAVNINSGFGGKNSSLILKRWEGR